MSNRKRAEAITAIMVWEDDLDKQTIRNAIEAALDEAEKRGRMVASSLVSKLEGILDEVLDVDGCIVCYGDSKSVLGGECPTCNGTGLGPIARYVEEARG